MISVVLPTYCEAASIQEVLRRASRALQKTGEPYELIVVDDSSPDGTAELAEALSGELPVRVVRRPGRSGLAQAVVEGWKAARGDVLGVIDADLQHPPEVLTRLVDALRGPSVDLVIASRAEPGGGTKDWSWVRSFTSWTAVHLATCVLPWTLAEVHDAMSGMFLVRARALEGVELEPTGYKILLEVLAKAHYRRFVEVPYTFGPRHRGSSKLGARQTVEYLVHLARLAGSTGQLRTWFRYAAVGLTGAIVHLLLLLFLVQHAGWPVGWALPAAIQFALLSNFTWNNVFTFRHLAGANASEGLGLAGRLVRYEAVCLTGAVLNTSLTLLLLRWNWALPLAAWTGLALGGVWNLFFNVPAIWRTLGARRSLRHVPVARPIEWPEVL
jgi:dolichol-phosphate mannosyltransferase